jgi:hypothetical protein
MIDAPMTPILVQRVQDRGTVVRSTSVNEADGR